MEAVLIHPTYGCPISQYAAIAQATEVIFEAKDNYQKQTYRNRKKIATSLGLLQLNIPILHNKHSQERQQTFEVRIENKFHWQRDHWRSLKVAYQTSPYFEFYEDTFEPLYHTNYDKLVDFIFALHEVIMDCLQIEKKNSFTATYEKVPQNLIDLRHLALAKKEPAIIFPEYHQLFREKHGYLPNLSVLDLLFNEGPNAITYLENIDLTL
jgi:hypothetical protein